MTGTGEKKCRPMTRSGRCVQAAISAIGIEDVLEARKTAAGSRRSRSANSLPLTRGILGDGLHHRVDTVEIGQVIGVGDPPGQRLGLLGRQLAAGQGSVERGRQPLPRTLQRSGIGLEQGHVDARRCRRLGDPRAHEARADDRDAGDLRCGAHHASSALISASRYATAAAVVVCTA